MGKRLGKNCSVKLGSDTVVGIGKATINGVSVDDVDFTAFLDDFKQMESGLKDGGTISFDGYCDVDDVTGQEALRYYQNEGTDITNLFIYVDNTSRFEACQTAGYWSPNTTQNASTVTSSCRITSVQIDAAVADSLKISFEAKVDGIYVFV